MSFAKTMAKAGYRIAVFELAQAALTPPGPRPILLGMDWVPVLSLTAIFAGMAVGLIRTVKKGRRRWMITSIPLVVAILALLWAAYRRAWAELGVAAVAAAAIGLGWWFAYGRRLPPPTDDNIRVWTKEDLF